MTETLSKGIRRRGDLFEASLMRAGRRTSASFPTEAEAAQWRANLAVRHDRGAKIAAKRGGMTVGQIWPEYLAQIDDPTTAGKHRAHYSARVRKAWAHVPLKRVSVEGVEEWIKELRRAGLAESTMATELYVLSAILTYAIRKKYLADNVVRSVDRKVRPHPRRTTFRVIEAHEFDRMLAEAPDDATRALLLLMWQTGARFSEAGALAVRGVLPRRVRFDQRIDRATSAIKPGLKNGDTYRDGPLGDELRETLAPLIEGKAPDDLVFTAARGGVLNPHNWNERVWRPLVARANLPGEQPTPHDMRHTYATHLGREGYTHHDLRDLLGHRDSRSLDVYLHTDEDLFDRVADSRSARTAKRHLRAV
jgi:site-specific recombinase XerD